MATKKRKRKVSSLGGSQALHAKDLLLAFAAERRAVVDASKASTCKDVIDHLLHAAFVKGRVSASLTSLNLAARNRWRDENRSVNRELAAITKAALIKCRVY